MSAFGAAVVDRAAVRAQEPAPSRLAEGRPSATAQVTANLRAAHQLVDNPKIFDDPLALRIIRAQAEAAVRAQAGRGPVATFRPFVAVRSRYTEDELARAVQRGVRQYVVLGAGLDTDLRGLGFTQVEDLGLDDLHARYFKGRTDPLRLNGLARLAKAGV